MSTSVTVSFVADAGSLVIDGHVYGPPGELTNDDFKTRDVVAHTAAREFITNGTASGEITVTAA